MVRIASSDRVVLERTETLGERDMLGLADHLVPQEQYLVREQRLLARSEQIVIQNRLGEIDPDELGADVRRELFDPHQITKIEEPVVFPASMSLCAWTASSSSYRWLISILMRPLATWSNRAVASSARSAGPAM